ILDEPTAVLSPPQAAELFKSMRTLAAAGKSIIFITHRLREVGAVASEVTILRQGKVVADRAVAGLDAQQMSVLMIGSSDAGGRVETRPGAAGDVVLRLEAVTVEGRSVRALDDMHLEVRRGEIVGVAGISGNGQTALAEVAAGSIRPAAGRSVSCSRESWPSSRT